MEEPATTQSLDMDACRHRLLAWHARDPAAVSMLRGIALDTTNFQRRMRALEEAVAHNLDPPLKPVDLELFKTDSLAGDLYRRLRDSRPLQQLVSAAPPLSAATPLLVATLCQIADVHPEMDGRLVSQDHVFNRIMDRVAKRSPVSSEGLLQEDFGRLAAVLIGHREALKYVEGMASQQDWPREMEQIELLMEDPGGSGSGTPLSENGASLLQWARQQQDADFPSDSGDAAQAADEPAEIALKSNEVTRLFLGDVRFSAMLSEEVRAFAAIRKHLPRAEKLVASDLYKKGLSNDERQRILAQKAVELLPADLKATIEMCLRVRIEAAKQYADLRAFVKLDALVTGWPVLSTYLEANRAALVELESLAVSGQANEVLLGSLSAARTDHRLMRFLQMRPLIKDIYATELKAYLATSGSGGGAAAPMPASVAKESRPTFYRLDFSIRRSDSSIIVALQEQKEVIEQHLQSTEMLTLFQSSIERLSGDVQQTIEIGRKLFDWAFPPLLRARLLLVLQNHRRVRLTIHADDGLLALPWETMYVSDLNGFLNTHGCSIVRWLGAQRPKRYPRFDRPLRVLAVFSNPVSTAPIDVHAEMEVLQRACAAAQESGALQLSIVGPKDLTRQSLNRAIRSFKPQLFHFVGHGVYDTDKAQGALIVSEPAKPEGWEGLQANEIGSMLSSSGVLLAVLNSCDTGTSRTNAAVTGVAGTLVKQGIPAVVATIRYLPDQTAVMFSKNFYSALAEGESVEGALMLARTTLEVEHLDWSVYALYANTQDLERLVVDAQRAVTPVMVAGAS